MGVINFSGSQWEELRGQLDRTNKKLVVVDKRLARFEAQESDAPPWTGAGGPGVADFLSQTRGSPGIVVDPAVAREPTPCLCYEIESRSGHSNLCFHHGVVGALDKGQVDLYCQTKVEKPPTAEQKARLEDFQASADTCKTSIEDVPKGQELEPWLSCMSAELRSRGRALSGVPTVDSVVGQADQIPVSPTPMVAKTQGFGAEAVPSAPLPPSESAKVKAVLADPDGPAHPGLAKYAQQMAG
ncbi:MAG TPA: hypothetical protein VMV23_09360 [Candidatus Nanopelagicaceae bacterium]|nr:hypothetical protein [Candidatus Nanopelagicaceae bacterium]